MNTNEYQLGIWRSGVYQITSKAKRPCALHVDYFSVEEALEHIFNDEDSADGMESDEDSDLDWQLECETEESR